jgi:hypothetical protein
VEIARDSSIEEEEIVRDSSIEAEEKDKAL